MNSGDLVKEFIDGLKKKPVKRTKKLFVIAMMGFPGSGKSTLARKISEALGIPIASNDEIRGFLMVKGLMGDKVEEVMEEIIRERRQYFLDMKASFIMDADTWPHWERVGRQLAEGKASMLLVKVEASEEEILLRLKNRKKDKGEYNAGLEDYLRRKKRWEDSEPPKDIYFVFNTEGDIPSQFAEFVLKIKREGYI